MLEASGGACNLRQLYILITAVPITTTPSHSTQACASRFDDFFKTPILISAAYPKRLSSSADVILWKTSETLIATALVPERA